MEVSATSELVKHLYSDELEFKSLPPPTLMIPTTRRPDPLTIKELTYIKTIGYGSTCIVGVVETACDNDPLDKPGTLFALKIVRKVVARSQENGQRVDGLVGNDYHFKNVERICLGNLPWNPFVAGLITTDDDFFNLYTVLELFVGGSLEDFLESAGPQPPQDARFYFAGISLGVDFLHRQGLLHCDIKPDNILICPAGYPVLTDFGIIRKIEVLEEDQKEWFISGTPSYMCPEIHVENDTKVPKCSPTIIDWWSVACTLFTLIEGGNPFITNERLEADTQEAIIERIVTRRFIRSIDSLAAGPNCKDLVSKFMHLDPCQRIGAKGTGLQEIQEHPWMRNIDWKKLLRREYLSPNQEAMVPVKKQRQTVPLPRKLRVPKLEIWQPPAHLAYDPKAPKTPT
ncbi:kinase-like domain-containing protein [Armillaria novae-zelandiae]|uniref:cAMP-dependent protein kinase n=1 Tax=Armillaria novae-zelandiae TaxID=153914 RepID=A0AA39PEC8_9AGAR|nr:kinase-like domain-containing protein [Armillaria novae-zelandiae]